MRLDAVRSFLGVPHYVGVVGKNRVAGGPSERLATAPGSHAVSSMAAQQTNPQQCPFHGLGAVQTSSPI